MGRKFKAIALVLILGTVLLTFTGCGSKTTGSTDPDNANLTFTIWDVGQLPGMQAIVDAYREDHPNVNIEVQVTNWNEYWTKLEAGITSNTAPDVFWMHSTYIYDYADAGVLADTTDLFDPDDFADTALACCEGTDGRYYSVPKDKDTVGLVYNKELFDQAGVKYPNADWTWTELSDASAKIYDKTGKYGFMAYNDEQLGYWPFVFQAGGYIINDDKTEAGFTNDATSMAIKYYVDLQKNSWCPDQNFFAQNSPGDVFFSGNGAMYLEGSWNTLPKLENYPEMDGKWDIAVLPKCPTPAEGDGRATVSNSLGYATTEDGPNKAAALQFIEFCGTEEAQRIQGTTGTAIPAYNGLEDTWVDYFADNGYDWLDVNNFIEMFDYSHPLPNDKSRPSWRVSVNAKLLQIYNGNLEYEVGLQDMQDLVDEAMVGD